MNDYLKNITPDSFSGIVFALEGIKGAVTVINGPSGCRFYHAMTAERGTIRYRSYDRLDNPRKWFLGSMCVPCTMLESRDYIYGSKEKLSEALEFLRDSIPFELLCVVNSPGAALIGDDLRSVVEPVVGDKPFVVIETPGYSSDICAGYERAVMELVRQLQIAPVNKRRDAVVNLLGLSLYHRNCSGDIAELTRLMRLCGIGINCIPCADCSLENIRRLPEAALNIVAYPEYGTKTAQYLQLQFGMPYYICDGPPIGFSATEKMMRAVCQMLNKECAPFMDESERARARAYSFISRVHADTGLPKGVGFAVEGCYSELYAYAGFLVGHFGMIIDCASVQNGQTACYRDKFIDRLNHFGLTQAVDRSIMDTGSEIVLASGGTIANLRLRKHRFTGIEIALPSIGYLDVTPKTHLGLQGALMLTEQILNGLLF